MYALGIDLGTTFSSAGLWRSGRSEICSLGNRSTVIPSVVYAGVDGAITVGELAGRRAMSEPQRVGREFKRRFGDSVPLLLGGVPYSAEALTAHLLAAIVEQVTAREGSGPSAICVTHPANWGPFKIELLERAVDRAGIEVPVLLTSEPEAAAVFYAVERPIPTGAVIAVYDLGGGTFDATVLRKADDGFELLGRPVGIEQLGGMDIDAAVMGHVARNVGLDLTELDRSDTGMATALAQLGRECVEAKEALSAETEVTIPVNLPGISSEVRLLRSELERMIRPMLRESVAALSRAIESAGVPVGDVTSVLLVGGAARTPLVGELVGSTLGLPVVVDTHPKHPVALGAAWRARVLLPDASAKPVGESAGRGGRPAAPGVDHGFAGEAITAALPVIAEDAPPFDPVGGLLGPAPEVLVQEPPRTFGRWRSRGEAGRWTRFRPLLAGSVVLLLTLLVTLGARALWSPSGDRHDLAGAGQTLAPGSGGDGALPGAGPGSSESPGGPTSGAGSAATATDRTGGTAGGTARGTTARTSGTAGTGTGTSTSAQGGPGAAAPQAKLALSPGSGHMDLPVQATVTLQGGSSPLTRTIDWGDGQQQTLTGNTAAHTYTSPCSCTAKLTVTAADGRTVSSKVTVTVAALAYGPDTCLQGYVWREAYSSSDHVCVTGDVRSQAADDNAHAAERLERNAPQ